MNHFLALFEPLWLHWYFYFLLTMTAHGVNVVFSLIHLNVLVRKVPAAHWHVWRSQQHLFSCSFPLLLFQILLCPCGCTACVMLLCHHIPPWPVPDSKLYWQGERKEKNRAEGRNWLRWQTERRQERVAHWDHCRCDAMEMLVAPAHNLELKAYNHNMFITRFLELIVEYRGFKRIWPH